MKGDIIANKGTLQNSGNIWGVWQSRMSTQFSQNLNFINKRPSEIRSSYITPRKMISTLTKKMNDSSGDERSCDNSEKGTHDIEKLIRKICLAWIIGLVIFAFFTILQWNYVNDWEIENSSKLNCKIIRWLDKHITSRISNHHLNVMLAREA